MDKGGHIVSSGSLYGGSHNLFTHTLPRFGITATLVNPRNIKAFEEAIRPETRLIFAETLGNPGLEVLDTAALAEVAHRARLPLMVDNTFATPYLFRPVEWGSAQVPSSFPKADQNFSLIFKEFLQGRLCVIINGCPFAH